MEMIVLKPDAKKLSAKLVEAERHLAQHPGAWVWLEEVGRIRRALGDSEYAAYLRQAVANYTFAPLRSSGRDRPSDSMRVGSLHRLLGDLEQASAHFRRAHELFEEQIAEHAQRKYADLSLDIEHMVEPTFLLGWDDQVAELMERLRRFRRAKDVRAYTIAKLAAARLDGDVALATDAVNEFARRIRGERAQIWNTGGISLWDWYEIATQVRQGLSPGQPP